MLAIVVSGGDLVLSDRVAAAARAADYVIAADSGARHLDALGRTPDLLLGDFDSYLPNGAACEIMRFPADKDATDTQLAVREARRRGADRVVLLAALRGDRLDHGAANLLLLSAREFRDFDLRALDGQDELRAVRSRAEVAGKPGDLVTLLSVTRIARGVVTAGLAYPLHRAVLKRGDSHGVSNVLVSGQASVSLDRGVLLLIHRDGGDPNALGRPDMDAAPPAAPL